MNTLDAIQDKIVHKHVFWKCEVDFFVSSSW